MLQVELFCEMVAAVKMGNKTQFHDIYQTNNKYWYFGSYDDEFTYPFTSVHYSYGGRDVCLFNIDNDGTLQEVFNFGSTADEYVTVTANAEDYTIKIYDMAGKPYYQKPNCTSITTINTKSFKEGIYLIIFEKDSNKHISKKLLIRHWSFEI